MKKEVMDLLDEGRHGQTKYGRWKMATDFGIIGMDLLSAAPYGAYAVNLSQTIWYWNPSAERITGHQSQDVIGYRCYQLLQNFSGDGDTPVCQYACPSLRATSEGRIPLVYEVRMLCASGQRKLVTITPLIIAAAEAAGTVLVHLFHEAGDQVKAARIAETVQNNLGRSRTVETTGDSPQITEREVEVLRLIALGLRPHEIAGELHISYHTVRNHISNMRRKLKAKDRLDLVINAQGLGII